MKLTEKYARYSLSKLKGIGSIKFKEILEYYPNIETYCNKNHIKIDTSANLDNALIFGDNDYPNSLKNIADAPIVLYKKGSLSIIPSRCVAIVGTRKITDYGIKATKKIAEYFTEKGYTIVSGMASGVDTIAHEVAVNNNLPTIAVLGTDVNTPYPMHNRNLYEKILNNGIIISENEKYTQYNKWVFPQRNRIIAGLADIVIVIEAPIKSGALITANFAFDYGKKLYALPGNIFQGNSYGCNMLISQNKAEIFVDSIVEYDINSNDSNSIESKVINLINSGCDTLDDLTIKLYISKSVIQNILIKLEFSRIIAKDLFGRYIVVC